MKLDDKIKSREAFLKQRLIELKEKLSKIEHDHLEISKLIEIAVDCGSISKQSRELSRFKAVSMDRLFAKYSDERKKELD